MPCLTRSTELLGPQRRIYIVVLRPGVSAGFQTRSSGECGLEDAQVVAMLVRRCIAGDVVAWEEIVQRYNRRIYNICYRFAGSSDDAQDLTQEVFIRVYKSLDQYNPKQGDLQNWLMRLARKHGDPVVASIFVSTSRLRHDTM